MKIKILFFWAVVFFISSSVFATEQITLTTYYPSPFGAYDRVRLLPRPELTTIPCDLGLMYFRNSDNRLQVCEQGSTGPEWGPVGLWKQTGSDIYPKGGPSINVGIGTISPDYKLEVNGNSLFDDRVGIGKDPDNLALLNVGLGDPVAGLGTEVSALFEGNVGIGELSPQGRLHVTGGNLLLMQGNEGIGLINPLGKLHVQDGNVYVMNGDVGIGTTSPSGRLQVQDGHAFFMRNVGIGTTSTTTGGGGNYRLRISSGGDYTGISVEGTPAYGIQVTGTQTALNAYGNSMFAISATSNSGWGIWAQGIGFGISANGTQSGVAGTTSGGNSGVYGQGYGSSAGVMGVSVGSGPGVSGTSWGSGLAGSFSGNVFVSGTLGVFGRITAYTNMTVNGTLTADNFDPDSIDADYIKSGGDLDVDNNATIGGNLTVGGDLTVKGTKIAANELFLKRLQLASGAHVTPGGVWMDASSRNYKQDITNLSFDDAVKTLRGLEPVRYSYKNNQSERHLGFIAEDVPDLVASLDRKSLSSMDIVAVLTRVVQQQQQMIEKLDNEIQKLKNTNGIR